MWKRRRSRGDLHWALLGCNENGKVTLSITGWSSAQAKEMCASVVLFQRDISWITTNLREKFKFCLVVTCGDIEYGNVSLATKDSAALLDAHVLHLYSSLCFAYSLLLHFRKTREKYEDDDDDDDDKSYSATSLECHKRTRTGGTRKRSVLVGKGELKCHRRTNENVELRERPTSHGGRGDLRVHKDWQVDFDVTHFFM